MPKFGNKSLQQLTFKEISGKSKLFQTLLRFKITMTFFWLPVGRFMEIFWLVSTISAHAAKDNSEAVSNFAGYQIRPGMSQSHFIGYPNRLKTSSSMDAMHGHHYSKEKLEQLAVAELKRKDVFAGKTSIWTPPSELKMCSYDSTCWRLYKNTAISNAIMYTRSTGKSCEQCLRTCLNDRSLPNPYRCRAAVYDYTFHICDLFAVTGFRWPQFLSRYDNRDFFEPLPICDSPTLSVSSGSRPRSGPSPGAPGIEPPITTAELPDRSLQETESGGEFLQSVTDGIRLPTAEEFPVTMSTEFAVEELGVEQSASSIGVIPSTAEEFGFGSTLSQENREFVLEATDLGDDTNLRNATSIPIEQCDSGSPETVSRFCKFENWELRGFSDVTLAAETEKDCVAACAANEHNHIQVLNCHSFNYRDNQCVMSSDDRETAGPIVKSEGVTYYEKQCYPASLVEGTELVWTVIPDMILAGHVMEVTDALNLMDCKMHCLSAQFQCISIMFYPEDFDQNCILNSEDRHTVEEKDSFGPENLGIPVFYVEIPRAQNSRRLKDDVLEQQSRHSGRRWTLWSSCSLAKRGISYRYLKCREKDIRRCPKDARKCPSSDARIPAIAHPALTAENEANGVPCLARRDRNGNKHCPHGVQRLPNGTDLYCRSPIDCP